jgi:CBS domain-containing protein
MTTTVYEFVKGKPPVVTVTKDEALTTALRRMIEHDFSQLPVVNGDNVPEGIITSDSILRALSNFGVVLNDIRLRHAMVKKPYQVNENIDLLDLFDDMRDGYALIINDEGQLVGIVTSYDTTEYFRQRAQDILLVENIESTLKDFVQLAFSSHKDGEARLEKAIESMTNANADLRKRYEKGVRHYLRERHGADHTSVDKTLLDRTFEQYLDDKRPSTSFDRLTLANYISLFLHKEHWARFADIFELHKSAVENLLKSVLQTRNDLSHFRDITRDQSAQLRDCYDLLVSHQQAVAAAFAQDDTSVEDDLLPDETPGPDVDMVAVVDEEPSPGDSRYAPLAIWLQNQPPEKELVKPTFARIEEIIGGKLPESAYKNRAWWANDSKGHVQSKQWLDVGWRVASVNMSERIVRFARIKERQKAYIDFYSALIRDLQQQSGFTSLQNLPDGANWYTTRSVTVRDKATAIFAYSFGRGSSRPSEKSKWDADKR